MERLRNSRKSGKQEIVIRAGLFSSHRRQNHTGGPILLLKGTLLKATYTAKEGSVFPGTQRDYQIYLPAGFEKTKPAAFMVFQYGVIYQAPVVFDNLIAKKDIPLLVDSTNADR